MMECLELSCTPVAEDCAQVGSDGYSEKARRECKALIGQLRRMFGEEPGSARLTVKGNAHDFGTYYEVAVKFNENDEEACDYAYKLERGLPEYWDAKAKEELGV